MKSTSRSRRHRNLHQHEAQLEKPFFSKSKEKPQPFIVANSPSNTASVQPKLKISQPGDKFEKEADDVANRVSQQQRTSSVHNQLTGSIQRVTLATPQEDEKLGTAESRMEKDKLIQEKQEEEKATVNKAEQEEEEAPVSKMEEEEAPVSKMEEEEAPVSKMEEEEAPVSKMEEEEAPVSKMEEEEAPVSKMEEEEEAPVSKMEEEEASAGVQMKEESGASAARSGFAARLYSTANRGAPLSKKIRLEMEKAFGVDFSKVRIHTDETAVALCKEIHAQAFTRGHHIYFNAGKFKPESSTGKKLLAHELTHVLQQTLR